MSLNLRWIEGVAILRSFPMKKEDIYLEDGSQSSEMGTDASFPSDRWGEQPTTLTPPPKKKVT